MSVSIDDVAKYIMLKLGSITAMKLQKLLYYCQAWSLVWDEEPLFEDEIEAWANGPVIRKIYNKHKGIFKIDCWPDGDISKLSDIQIETIDAVILYYGHKTSQWLVDLTHNEDPWREARNGLLPGERGSNIITHASIYEYYSSL